ncbi:MAG: ribonuclease P [Candidatus Lokiarchaeota archaeon]|nr:ribonuclease P [Candidatus Lokiarchaeota archaeon]
MPNFNKIAEKLAKTRIFYLFNLANDIFLENKELANEYVDLARKYAKMTKLKLPKIWNRRICHGCKKFLYPGNNTRVRLQSRKGKASHISITCLDCNHVSRYNIKKKR